MLIYHPLLDRNEFNIQHASTKYFFYILALKLLSLYFGIKSEYFSSTFNLLTLSFSHSFVHSCIFAFNFHSILSSLLYVYFFEFFVLVLFSVFFLVLLVIFTHIRYNGFLPQGDKGRRRSKFVLYKRPEANGVRRSRHYIVQSPQTSKAILDANQHSISYTLSRNQAVIVEYKEDADTDMFQVNILLYNAYT